MPAYNVEVLLEDHFPLQALFSFYDSLGEGKLLQDLRQAPLQHHLDKQQSVATLALALVADLVYGRERLLVSK